MIVIQYLDYLSPHITFYHNGFLSHTSIISGILSIISFVLIVIIAVYFSLDLIKRQNPTTFSFNSFIEDSGKFYFNSSDVFHFISIALGIDGYIDKGVDFTMFRIIGLDVYISNYTEDISKNNHWLYGLCNNENDTKGISHLIKEKFFLQSACIRKYYNATEKKYYDTSDENFRWPVIAHGTYHPEHQYYGIFVQACRNETIGLVLGKGSHCKSFNEINEIVSKPSSTHLFYIDNYVDSLNYKNPNTKFFNRVENSFNRERILTNNINLDPVLVKTHNGLVLDNEEEHIAYTYERNDVLTYDIYDSGFYTIYYFWLSNIQNFYNRKYKRVQDIISDIGGINQFITIISTCINFIFNGYVVLSDTENLLFSSINTVKNNDVKLEKLPVKPIKHENIKNIKINKNISNGNKMIDNLNSKRPNNKDDKNNISHKNISINEKEYNTESIINIIGEKSNKNDKQKIQKINYENKKINNFLNYLVFKLTFEKRNNHLKTFRDFRIKMLSEEHVIKNHLNICNLLKVHQHRNSFKRNSYQLKDLINLL